MSRRIAIGILLTVVLASKAKSDHPSSHGMLVVGESAVYLSHLPLFHQPHDYQVLLEARFSGKDGSDPRKLYVEDRRKTGTAVYTIEPETFELPEQIRKKKPFQATLYRGHFERGGEPIAKDVTVTIERVLHFRKFAATAARPVVMEALVFGNASETFLANRIVTPPDFDQIVAVKADPPFTSGDLSRAVVVRLGARGPLEQGQELDGAVGKGPVRKLSVTNVLYTEVDELKQ